MKSITSLEQARDYLLELNIIDLTNNTVDGKDLLDACGYYYTKKNWGSVLDKLTKRHQFIKGVDFTSHTIIGVPRKVKFTVESASLILLCTLSGVIIHTHSRKETHFRNILESAFKEEKIVTQQVVLDYRVDFYFPKYNLVVEYDESYHKGQACEDEIRQTNIENELGCSFIRVPEGEEGAGVIEIYKFINE